jgi:Ni2+-binding GTPase involved in maturation of urease and hydrogenase
MVLGFSWLVEKVMNKMKDQGIKLIVVKVDIFEFGDNEFPRIDLDPIILHWFQLNRPR